MLNINPELLEPDLSRFNDWRFVSCSGETQVTILFSLVQKHSTHVIAVGMHDKFENQISIHREADILPTPFGCHVWSRELLCLLYSDNVVQDSCRRMERIDSRAESMVALGKRLRAYYSRLVRISWTYVSINSGSFLHTESLVRAEDGASNVNVSLAASDANNSN